MPRRVDDYRGLTQPRRLRLLRAVQSEPGLRIAELAERCGMPLNTARDHLRVLVQEGLVREERLQVGSRGRPPIAYHPVDAQEQTPAARRRLAGAQRRGQLLRAVTGAARSGTDAEAAQLDVLYEHLDDAGLEPVLDEDRLRFDLAPCAYHALIAEDQATVCGMHARLVRDTLGQVDGPLDLAQLQPFVTAHSCALTLGRRAESDAARPDAADQDGAGRDGAGPNAA